MLQLLLFSLISVLFFSAHSEASPFVLDRDFFTTKSEGRFVGRRLETNEDCRAQIARAVCLVDPIQPGQKPERRECLAGSLTYSSVFENLYDQYPLPMQQMFCSLKRIFIEKKSFGTAYAGFLRDEAGKPTGVIMGIRRSVIDKSLSLSHWASWREQLSFGADPLSYNLSPELPVVEAISPPGVNDLLYFVVAHEFGHFFDIANEVNKTKSCSEPANKNQPPECKMHEDGWGGISWITAQKPKLVNEFPLRTSLCFYRCNGEFLNKSSVSELYRDLERTDFISNYAATGPWDDFADSVAYYMIHKSLGGNYRLDTRQGQSYDAMSKLRSPLFTRKLQYLDAFFSRTDLLYP